MRNSFINEYLVEQATLAWLESIDYQILSGDDIAPDGNYPERASYDDVLLEERLRVALERINGHIPASALSDVITSAIHKIKQLTGGVMQNNQKFHSWLVDGMDEDYLVNGEKHYVKLMLIDTQNPNNNDFLAVNQFTITDLNATTRHRTKRRPDVLLFVNGMPIVIIELKNPADEQADNLMAYKQLVTYQNEIPTLFTTIGLLMVSDGNEALIGTTGAEAEFFKAWRAVDDGEKLDPFSPQLQTLIKGVFDKTRLLDILRHFIVFSKEGVTIAKKLGAYHQYYAVNKAVEKTLEAIKSSGKIGVIWHTQGSGKSLTMLFYAGKLTIHPEMTNPTLVILTDRNDLDDQLFSTFAGGHELLRDIPKQAENRTDLQTLLRVPHGGVIFTTIQKFMPDNGSSTYPTLSERRNIVVIADEAHRSQYGFNARMRDNDITYGYAKYLRDALPNASFIGFTGTPIEQADANTRAVFGDYIDVYDIQRAIDDKATVPIYYEARMAKLKLDDDLRPRIDPEFEELTEGQEADEKEKLKTKWSQLEAMVGTKERLSQIADDIVAHFETRLTILDGKAMIVCMSRRIAVDLYNALIALRPEWHNDDDQKGQIKVIMTGSASDPLSYLPHTRNKPRRQAIANRFKDVNDELKIVIVRDMWLTGFDVPSLHTMYVDKPMRGHSLMQAIARVNRVFKDKPGGLIVDYLGIATELQSAVKVYTDNNSSSPIEEIQKQVVDEMLNRYAVVRDILYGFAYEHRLAGSPTDRLSLIPDAMEFISAQKGHNNKDDGKLRFIEQVGKLSKLLALAISHDDAIKIRDEVAFFQAVRAQFLKNTVVGARIREDMDSAIKQLVSEAVSTEGVINIFESMGIKSPDISILSEDFLGKISNLPQRNLALELLHKLIRDEIRARSGKNAIQGRSFALMLDETIQRYQNRTIDIAQVVHELIGIAREIQKDIKRGEELGLDEAEVAFYDALANNKSAVQVLGDANLRIIAEKLVETIRNSVTIDWTIKKSARAQIRVQVKRLLRQFGYPPDLYESATDSVLEQAELFAEEWVKKL